jgi:hypothetical protein
MSGSQDSHWALGNTEIFTIIAPPTKATGEADMSDEQVSQPQDVENTEDTRADTKAIIVMFVAATFMAVHFISGFTFDF